MVLSRGKKIILFVIAILVVVIAVIVGFFAIQEKQHLDYQCETAAEVFLGISDADEDEQSSMFEGKGKYGAIYTKVKYEPAFERALTDKINEIIENPSGVLWRVEDQFGVIIDAISTLEQEEIYSESIRSAIQEYLTGTKAELFARFQEKQTFADILRLEELDGIVMKMGFAIP